MKNRYEAVISGMAGSFPESNTVEEFKNNLMNKLNLITTDDRRFTPEPPFDFVPHSTGKANGVDLCDMTYFGLHRRLCQVTDPHQRMCLEMTLGAMVDAGYNPSELHGTRTAVIAASVISETEYECLLDPANVGISILGHSRGKQANRISYTYHLTGPSYMIDSSWNGAMDGLAYAASLIEEGLVQRAVVACASLLFSSEISFHHYKMGRLNKDGNTKSFSDDADGYSRSEGCVVFFVERKDEARRIYGSLITCPSFCMGSKMTQFTEIPRNRFISCLENFYEHANIDVNSIGFVEASGVASKVVDAVELNAIGDVLLKNRKEPLLIGCVKSNAGHAEAAASGLAVAKALIVADSGVIPPNLHYSKPNSLVPYLKNGQMKVVTEPTPLTKDIIAVNSFSAISAASHLLIKRHAKQKKRLPKKNELPPDGLARLFLLSGRTEAGVIDVLKKVEQKPIDEEYVALANRVFKNGIKKHLFRGFTILNDKEKVIRSTKAFFTGGQDVLPIWYVFTGMGSQWAGMGLELMKIPVFARAIQRSHETLKPKGLNLIDIITTRDAKIFDNILHSFVGIAAIQIGLVDVLNELGITPDGMVGHSVGELGCAYADGCFTAEQMILAAYARGRASIETDLIPGMMAAVGQGFKNIKQRVPEGIEVACHNSADSCTLSGPTELMEEFITKLKSENIFAKLVNVANIAYHSRYIRPAAPALLRYLKEVIPEPKLRSSKWISSSVPESDWDKESAKYCSAEYHTNNLLGSVLFEEASSHIPEKAIIIEIAPHGLLQAILKRRFTDAIHVPLTNRADADAVIHLLGALGKLYLEGVSMDIEKLYPAIEFPVSAGTPSLDDVIVWDHSEKWRIHVDKSLSSYTPDQEMVITCARILLDPNTECHKYLLDYKIYGSPVIPLSFFIDLILGDYFLVHKQGQPKFIQLQNVALLRNQDISKEREMYKSLGNGTGTFEYVYGDQILACGVINSLLTAPKLIERHAVGVEVSQEEVYTYLKHMGHDLGPAFMIIKSVRISENEISALIQWQGSLTVFLDAVLKLPALLNMGENHLHLVTKIRGIILDLTKFSEEVRKDVLVIFNSQTNRIECDGLEILYPETQILELTNGEERTILCQNLQYVPYETPETDDVKELITLSLQIFLDNVPECSHKIAKVSIIEVVDKIYLHDELCESLNWKRNNNSKINITVAETDHSLAGYESDSHSEYCFIVSGSQEIHYSLKILKSCCGGFLFYVGDLPNLPEDVSLIFTKRIGFSKYSLLGLKKMQNENQKFISIDSPDWKVQVTDKLQKHENETIFVAGEVTRLSTIYNITRQFNDVHNAHLLRFIFVESFEHFQLADIKEQIEKDLKINIQRNGIWGCCLLRPKQNKLSSIAVNSTYKFSEVRMKGGKSPVALGLNCTDSANVNSKVTVLDYTVKEPTGEMCGIGTLIETTKEIIPDQFYFWKKPQDFSHEETASVLVNYAMAYYMLTHCQNYCFEETVPDRFLIHHGVLPLSQACITVGLSLNARIFTTYKDEEEKKIIMRMFPSLPESDVLCYDEQFHADILEMTNGGGVRVIVNTLPEKKYVTPTVSCLGQEGIFYQVGNKVMEENETVGIRILLKLTTLTGMNPVVLLNLPEEHKLKIQALIERGFIDGTIKPLSMITFPSDETNLNSLSILSSEENSLQKAVVTFKRQLSESFTGQPYLCDTAERFVIVGDEHCFWLDVVEWLAKKGAESVYVFVKDSTLTGITSEKLQRLLQKYKKLKISLLREAILRNPDSVGLFRAEIKKPGKCNTVFLIGKVPYDIMKTFLVGFPDDKIIFLNESAYVLCEERLKKGHPTLAVTLPHNLLSSYQLLPSLDQLLNEEAEAVFISEHRCNKDIDVNMERTEFMTHLPSSVDELLNLTMCPNITRWKETKSNTATIKSAPDLPPVFIIPPLKTGQMDILIKSLFYPTFVAQLAKSHQDFEQIAIQLHQDMKRFDCEVFTLVCSDWSWPIGVILGNLLEREGKTVTVIFFDASLTWNGPSAFLQVLNEVKEDLSSDSPNEKRNEKYLINVKNALGKLQHLLSLFETKLPSSSTKIKGFCHFITCSHESNNKCLDVIQQYCELPVNVYTSSSSSYLEMMADKATVNFINSNVLFEHKDAATKVERTYERNRIFENNRLLYLANLQSYHLIARKKQ